MSIIEYISEWLQHLSISPGVYNTISILVSFVDVLVAAYLLWGLGLLVVALVAIRMEEEGCDEQGSDSNNLLTKVAVDIGITHAILVMYEELKGDGTEKICKDELMKRVKGLLRKEDLMFTAQTLIVIGILGFAFDTYFSMIAIMIQGVCYSLSYEYSVPTTFKYRKKLNYDLFKEEE